MNGIDLTIHPIHLGVDATAGIEPALTGVIRVECDAGMDHVRE